MFELEPLGIIAAIVGLSAFLQARQGWMKLQLGSSSMLWAGHFIILGSPTSAGIQIAIGLRTWLTLLCHQTWQKHALFWVASSVFSAIAVATWEGPVSLLPTLAAINSTAAFAYGSNLGMRYMLLGSSTLWLANGLVWQSLPVIVTECIAITLNLTTIWRLRKTPPVAT